MTPNAATRAAMEEARTMASRDTMRAEIAQLRAENAALREALTLAEDVLSRSPYSTDFWPNDMHPNRGITMIREVLANPE